MTTFSDLPGHLKITVVVVGITASCLLASHLVVGPKAQPSTTQAEQTIQQTAPEELDEFGYPSKTRRLPPSEEKYVFACVDRYVPDHLMKWPAEYRQAVELTIPKCRHMYHDLIRSLDDIRRMYGIDSAKIIAKKSGLYDWPGHD